MKARLPSFIKKGTKSTKSRYDVRCYLVGAGPGSAQLLTLRAHELLQQADVIIYDRLVGRDILLHACVDAELIYIQDHRWRKPRRWQPVPLRGLGKKSTYIEREEIDILEKLWEQALRPAYKGQTSPEKSIELLVRVCCYFRDKALKNYQNSKQARAKSDLAAITKFYLQSPFNVVRLKGGDPAVFARAHEELAALRTANIPYRLVPGVASFTAAAAAAKMPLTQRETSQSFSVLTGHFTQKSEKAKRKVIAMSDTVIYLMGVKNIKRIVTENLKLGKPPSMPIAVIEDVSLPKERIRLATLGTILRLHAREPIQHPAILMIGKTVPMPKVLFDQENTKLAGLTIGILRGKYELLQLHTLINEEGGYVEVFPLVQQRVLTDYENDLCNCLQNKAFKVMLVTSKRTVTRLWDIFCKKGLDWRILGACKVMAIGKETAAAMLSYGLRADYLAQEPSQEGLARLIRQKKLDDILLPQAKNARPWLTTWLSEHGYQYKIFPLYQTALQPVAARQAKPMKLALQRCNVLLVTSESVLHALEHFMKTQRNVLLRENYTSSPSSHINEGLSSLSPVKTALKQVEQTSEEENLLDFWQLPLPVIIALSPRLMEESQRVLHRYFKQILAKYPLASPFAVNDYFRCASVPSYRALVSEVVHLRTTLGQLYQINSSPK